MEAVEIVDIASKLDNLASNYEQVVLHNVTYQGCVSCGQHFQAHLQLIVMETGRTFSTSEQSSYEVDYTVGAGVSGGAGQMETLFKKQLPMPKLSAASDDLNDPLYHCYFSVDLTGAVKEYLRKYHDTLFTQSDPELRLIGIVCQNDTGVTGYFHAFLTILWDLTNKGSKGTKPFKTGGKARWKIQ
jgi:hypothetical protein